jgi:hypothetical protein
MNNENKIEKELGTIKYLLYLISFIALYFFVKSWIE